MRIVVLLHIITVAQVAGGGLRRLRSFPVLLLLSPPTASFALPRFFGGGAVSSVGEWVQIAVRDGAVWLLRECLGSHVGIGEEDTAKTNPREYQSDLGVLCKKGKKLREMTKKIGFYIIYAPARDSLGRAKSRWAVSWPVLEIFVVWVGLGDC